jgi:hypothetical protein
MARSGWEGAVGRRRARWRQRRVGGGHAARRCGGFSSALLALVVSLSSCPQLRSDSTASDSSCRDRQPTHMPHWRAMTRRAHGDWLARPHRLGEHRAWVTGQAGKSSSRGQGGPQPRTRARALWRFSSASRRSRLQPSNSVRSRGSSRLCTAQLARATAPTPKTTCRPWQAPSLEDVWKRGTLVPAVPASRAATREKPA